MLIVKALRSLKKCEFFQRDIKKLRDMSRSIVFVTQKLINIFKRYLQKLATFQKQVSAADLFAQLGVIDRTFSVRRYFEAAYISLRVLVPRDRIAF